MSNELYHYGVLGMKWSVHRAKRNVKKAQNARFRARATEAVASSAKKKGNASKTARLNSLATRQREKGAKYDAKAQARAEGASRGEAWLNQLGPSLLNVLSSGIVGVVEPRLKARRS